MRLEKRLVVTAVAADKLYLKTEETVWEALLMLACCHAHPDRLWMLSRVTNEDSDKGPSRVPCPLLLDEAFFDLKQWMTQLTQHWTAEEKDKIKNVLADGRMCDHIRFSEMLPRSTELLHKSGLLPESILRD